MIELLKPYAGIKASIQLAGSKSISNRLLILNGLSGDELAFSNLSSAEDTLLLQTALTQINAGHNRIINIHHAGTDMRFLTAFLATREGTWTLTGSERMKQRPIGALVNALRELGADIHYLGQDGFPPLEIKGKTLHGGNLSIDSSVSSQFVSALILLAPALKEGLLLSLTGDTVSYPYIRMSLELLRPFGMSYTHSGATISVPPAPVKTPPSPFMVESDWSSASYWYSMCALAQQAEIKLSYLSENSLQADAILPRLFERLGVNTTFKGDSVLLTKKNILLTDFSYDFTACPDLAQTLAVTCFGLGIKATLTGLKTLKIKETDRILALTSELEKLGATVESTHDSLLIYETRAKKPVTNPVIATYHDHRMAMSFAPLALINEKIRIADPGVVAKSYPAFWEDLKSAGFSVNLQP